MTTFVDEKAIRLVFSPSHLLHVQGWFGETICGKWINYPKGWKVGTLTSLTYLGSIAQRPRANKFCATCAAEYKDINAD